MSDFTYTPSYATPVTDKFRELEARFGGGYVQTAPDGLNAVAEVWSLQFEAIPLARGEAIRAFLRSKVGASFTWTPPGGSEKRFRRIGEVTMPRSGPTTVNLTCTFEEWFGP